MALEVGAGIAGSSDGINCELADNRAGNSDATIWGHNHGVVVDKESLRFYGEDKRHLLATTQTITLE